MIISVVIRDSVSARTLAERASMMAVCASVSALCAWRSALAARRFPPVFPRSVRRFPPVFSRSVRRRVQIAAWSWSALLISARGSRRAGWRYVITFRLFKCLGRVDVRLRWTIIAPSRRRFLPPSFPRKRESTDQQRHPRESGDKPANRNQVQIAVSGSLLPLWEKARMRVSPRASAAPPAGRPRSQAGWDSRLVSDGALACRRRGLDARDTLALALSRQGRGICRSRFALGFGRRARLPPTRARRPRHPRPSPLP